MSEQHHDRSQEGAAFFVDFRWRTGRKVARNVYAVVDSEPSDADVLIGSFDTGSLAQAAVRAHNFVISAGFPDQVGGP